VKRWFPRSVALVAGALLAVLAVPPPAVGDVVELVSGERIEGRVAEVSATTVRVEAGGQIATFRRETVRAIYFGTSASVAPPGARAAVQALGTLRAAVTAGVNRQEYGTRLREAEIVVEKYVRSPDATDPALVGPIRAAIRYYQIVGEAWSPTTRERARIRSEPLLEECAGFTGLATTDALLPGSLSFPIGPGISVLWNCAGTRIDQAELALSGMSRR
jgi:hypothetical protein